MVTGNWLNNDGLPLFYGTSKPVPELGGDYVMYGENREIEVMISLGATSFGTPTLQAPTLPLPSSFQGTVASQSATANTGIVSYTTLFPLQITAPVTAAGTTGAQTGVLNIINPQLYIDQIDLECLVAANAGTGGATGLTGIGLVVNLPANGSNPSSWAQITPNAGVQLLGACANARMTAGAHYTWYGDGTAFGTATPPTAGSWLGNVPAVTLAESFLPGGFPNNAYISAIAAGGTYTGASGGGLLRLRVRYHIYGNINDATQI
jgi:hypothetical protein